jgi:hypothetical protein
VTSPASRSTGCWLLWFRADLPRERVREYWRGPHGRLVGAVPGLDDYRQHHFSEEDHGFWPGPAGVGTAIPEDWRVDGMPEVAFAGVLGPLMALGPRVVAVFRDEANAFDRVLSNLTGPRGGQWMRSGRGEAIGARVVVLIRRRPGVGFSAFRSFVHDVLGSGLLRAPGALEVRTHPFLPYSKALWPTPGVAHDNPPHRRYHAAVVIGAADREGLDTILASNEVAATHEAQAAHCVALHAYAVDETFVVVEDGRSRLA